MRGPCVVKRLKLDFKTNVFEVNKQPKTRSYSFYIVKNFSITGKSLKCKPGRLESTTLFFSSNVRKFFILHL